MGETRVNHDKTPRDGGRGGVVYCLAPKDHLPPDPGVGVLDREGEPMKYIMLAGIIMMLSGGFLLFLNNPGNREDAGSIAT